MLLAVPFALGIGISLGMLGAGGSVLVVPVLVYVLGQDVHDAATASLVIVTAAAFAGGAGQAARGNVCWRHAGLFAAAAVPGIVLGTAVGGSLSAGILLGAFGVLMLVAAYATLQKGARHDDFASEARCPALRVGWEVGLGSVVGFLTGFLGVGGGFVVIPALALAVGFRIRSAVGTSLAVITATGATGVAVHLAAGRSLDPEITISMTVAMIVGALAGARFGHRVSEVALARGFATLLSTVAMYLIVSAAFLGAPPA